MEQTLKISNGYSLITVNNSMIKFVKDVVKSLQGKGKEENRKLEGNSFGFLKNGILDYPIIFLERLFVSFNKVENKYGERQIKT